MRILVIGEKPLFQELAKKIGDEHTLDHITTVNEIEDFPTIDVAVDFTADESIDHVEYLVTHVNASLYLLNTVKSSLHEISYLLGDLPENIVGFNGLPGFIDRDTWEVTSMEESLPSILNQLPGEFIRVEDRVGMVTPRVICMIINEAYYTVQEGTASRSDIDSGMKLGTGYPHGPFEWAEIIGLNHVYELLEAMYEDTRDERYKICPLLRKEYLKLR